MVSYERERQWARARGDYYRRMSDDFVIIHRRLLKGSEGAPVSTGHVHVRSTNRSRRSHRDIVFAHAPRGDHHLPRCAWTKDILNGLEMLDSNQDRTNIPTQSQKITQH